MPAFWHWFVVALTILFIIWCVWLVSWSAKQGPKNLADDDLVGHKWDGDLEEWNNPAPKWWLYLYFITIIWGVGFLIAMPGLGTFKGMLGWTSAGAVPGQEPVCKLLHDLPWVRCARRQGFSEPD